MPTSNGRLQRAENSGYSTRSEIGPLREIDNAVISYEEIGQFERRIHPSCLNIIQIAYTRIQNVSSLRCHS